MNRKIIFLLITICLLVYFILQKRENFSNLNFEQQRINLLDKSITLNESLSCSTANENRGLYLIKSKYLSSTTDNYYLYIVNKTREDNSLIISDDPDNLPFGIINSNDSSFIDDKRASGSDGNTLVENRGAAVQIKNGIFIENKIERNNFSFSRLYHKSEDPVGCATPNAEFCQSPLENHLNNFKIIQYYEPVEEGNQDSQEIKYFIKHDNKFLYIENDADGNPKLKKLGMSEICRKMSSNTGDEYKYVHDIPNYSTPGGDYDKDKLKDSDTNDDIRFGRSYNNIPNDQMCPWDFPYACSGDNNWRNFCSKKPKIGYDKEISRPIEITSGDFDINDGKCQPSADKKHTQNNIPMRNFNADGLKCYLNQGTEEGPIVKNPNRVKEINNIFQEIFTSSDINKFLFSINSFLCYVKEKDSGTKEVSFCHSNPNIEKLNIEENDLGEQVKFYNELELKREFESCDIGSEEINNVSLKLSTNNNELHKVCAKQSKQDISEGITGLKTVKYNESCNEREPSGNIFPSNWKEAKNTSEILGCFGRNDYFKFNDNDKVEGSTGHSGCKNSSEPSKKYYSVETGDLCYQFSNVPQLPKYINFNKCNNKDTNNNFYADNLGTPIYRMPINNLDTTLNIQSNRLYNNMTYTIYNNSINKSILIDNNYLKTTEYVDNKPNTIVKIKKLTPESQFSDYDEVTTEPLRYNDTFEIIFLKENGDGSLTEKYIDINPITHKDTILISNNKNENSYIGLKQTEAITSNVRYKKNNKTEKFRVGYKLINTYDKYDNKNKIQFLVLNSEYNHLGIRTYNWDGKCVDSSYKNANKCASNKKHKYNNRINTLYKYTDQNDDWKLLYFTKGEEISGTEEEISGTEEEKIFGLDKDTDPFPHPYFRKSESDNTEIEHILDLTVLPSNIYINQENIYIIMNALTRFEKHNENGHTYGRDFRGFLPNNLEGYFDHRKTNTFQFKNLINNYLLPSKINKYKIVSLQNIQSNGNPAEYDTHIEKLNDNSPFKLNNNNTNNIDGKRLTFQIKNPDDETNTDYVNLQKDVYLYNKEYNLYISINSNDEHGISFMYNESLSNKSNYCKLRMKMNDLADNEIAEPNYKLCYKVSPFQSVNIPDIYMEDNCLTDITMNDNNIVPSGNKFSFCTAQEKTSQTTNDKFKDKIISENNPITPYPIPLN